MLQTDGADRPVEHARQLTRGQAEGLREFLPLAEGSENGPIYSARARVSPL